MVRKMIAKIFVKKKSGNKTYLIKDKESYIVGTSEIEGTHELPIDIATLTNELQEVLHGVDK